MKKNFSINKISRALGISASTLHNWERGKTNPSFKNLIKIALYFNVRANYLIGLED